MSFDPAFTKDVLLPLTNTAYQLSRGLDLVLPPGWQQTATITVDQATINKETACGLAKTVICEDCDWGIAARKDDISVIAIRGTETEHQWLEDFSAIAQPVAHSTWWIHHGFNDVWNALAASLQNAWNVASSDNARVYVTGHSLGAAIALIMGVNHPEAPTWTLAGPAVYSPIHGLPPAANIVRIVNPSDLVPKVPLPPLYQHIGQAVQVAGAADEFDFALQHSLDTYTAGLTKLVGVGAAANA